MRQGGPIQQMKKRQRGVAGTSTVGAGAKTWQMANNTGIQQGHGDPEKALTCTLNAKHPVAPANEKVEVVPPETVGPEPAASPALPSYPVGRGISLQFGQLLPQCANCNCNALIAMTHFSSPEISVLCLDHGLIPNSVTRDLNFWPRSRFISPEHEAAIRAVLT